ncbi:MAG: hypothetical protein FWF90_09640 [Promicromonosporaceae bacterium]|nr:hypothetical protein [Promicromonosporaceae bacterium]
MDGKELALAAIEGRPARGIPAWEANIMEHRMIDRLAGLPEGSYVREPEAAYMAMQRALSC